MKDRRDRLYPVNKPWAGADHEGVPVDGPHRNAGERRHHGRGLRRGARQVVPARRDQDQVGLGGGDLRPGEGSGALPRAGRDRLVSLSGRGDKDMDTASKYFGV